MKQQSARYTRRNRLSASFDRLCEKDQAYLETLTSQLAEIHETSPEMQFLTGKKPKTIVQQKKEQER
jgi:hypothetical protein